MIAADGLTIERSKTDQTGEGSIAYLSPATMEALVTDPQGRARACSTYRPPRYADASRLPPRRRDSAPASLATAARVGMAIDLARVGTDL